MSEPRDPPPKRSEPARRFSYYGDWRGEELVCPCGWSGALDPDEVEPYRTLMEFSCPECESVLAIVTYPTDEETLTNFDELSKQERVEALKRQQFLVGSRRLALERPDQLPDLEGDELTLQWDFVTEHKKRYTVIRHGTTLVWKERAIFEGARRFEEIAVMLETRYGARLRDLIPTEASEPYLYGDEMTAPTRVDRIRKSLSPET